MSEKQFDFTSWLRLGILNFFIVALVGVFLRYKILYALPWLDQKSLLYAHSNFAFTGWLSYTFFILIFKALGGHSSIINQKKFLLLIKGFLLSSYGLLISFFITGFSTYSIVFQMFNLAVGFLIFNFLYRLKASLKLKVIKKWFDLAYFFGVLSSFGLLYVVYMMVTKNIHQHQYLASFYWHLHFQYNGWFLFAAMGLFYTYLSEINFLPPSPNSVLVFFSIAAIPTFGLSILWLSLPGWAVIGLAAFALLQFIAWIIFIYHLKRSNCSLTTMLPKPIAAVWAVAALAFTIKLVMQLASTIPSLSKLAFGFRPIVLAYLHLIFLGIFSLFLIGSIFNLHAIHISPLAKKGIVLLIAAIVLNELLLGLQGAMALSYNIIPFINETLLGAGVFIACCLLILFKEYKLTLDQATTHAPGE